MIIALKAPLHICVLEPNIKASLAVKLSLQNADKHTTYILSDISITSWHLANNPSCLTIKTWSETNLKEKLENEKVSNRIFFS